MSLPRPQLDGESVKRYAPVALAAVAFFVLFWEPMTTLVRDWLHDPDAAHGLLLAPVAVWLAWRKGLVKEAAPQRVLGTVLLVGAVALRYLAGLAAELFTLRFSMWVAVVALIVFVVGIRQVLRWWLPATLLFLSIPLPVMVTGTLAFPLQLKASQMGAGLLAARHVPVQVSGNVINLPGRSLFVTEACSGLRSLTALLALGVLIGGLWLKHPASRFLLVALTLPVAMVLNAFRIFLTGFFVYYVSPALGEGLLHYTEGWAIFVAAFAILGLMAWVLVWLEGVVGRRLQRGTV